MYPKWPGSKFLFNTEKQHYIDSINILHFIKDILVDYEQVENFKLIAIAGNMVLFY